MQDLEINELTNGYASRVLDTITCSIVDYNTVLVAGFILWKATSNENTILGLA